MLAHGLAPVAGEGFVEGFGGRWPGLRIGKRPPGDEAFGVYVFENADFFRNDAAGDGKFEAEVGKRTQQLQVFFAPGLAARLRVAAAVVDGLFDAHLDPGFGVVQRPVAKELNLHFLAAGDRDFMRFFDRGERGGTHHGEPVSTCGKGDVGKC